MNYATIKNCDIANGPGVRVSLFVSGCTHRCPGCFNEVAWDFEYGQPFTEEVMETARKAGARGGTIIHARWAGSESTEEFFGITVQQEKEIIAIIAPHTKRNEIMEAIHKNHGLKTEARGTVCSLAIENMVKLG